MAHVLILGGGFGGVVAAKALATTLGPEHRITLISRNHRFVFSPALVRLALGECEIEVADATAVARCQGTVRFVRAFGSRDPVNAPTGWVFRLSKSGASWTIEDVTGAEASRD